MSIEDLQIYAGKYYFFEGNFPLFLSVIHSKCEDLEVRQSLRGNLWDEEHGEVNHLAMWLDFCAGLGLERDLVEFQSNRAQDSEVAGCSLQCLQRWHMFSRTGCLLCKRKRSRLLRWHWKRYVV